MTDFSGFVLEHSVDRGWAQFEYWLADVLCQTIDGDVLVVSREVGPGEPERTQQPHVEFTTGADGRIRGEVSSNRSLDRKFWLNEDQCAQLIALGFEAPSSAAAALASNRSTNFRHDVPRADVATLAHMSVSALREAFGILHPAFLSLSGDIHQVYDNELVDEPAVPDSLFPMGADGIPVSGTLARNWAIAEAGPLAMPESPAHLRQLIEQALAPVLGRRPLVDEDGDFVVAREGALVFIRVVESAPVVAVFSELVRGIGNSEAAVREVAELNASVEMVKFFLVGDRIVAGCTLPANPFVGGHLRELLDLVASVAAELHEPVTSLVGEDPAFGA